MMPEWGTDMTNDENELASAVIAFCEAADKMKNVYLNGSAVFTGLQLAVVLNAIGSIAIYSTASIDTMKGLK